MKLRVFSSSYAIFGKWFILYLNFYQSELSRIKSAWRKYIICVSRNKLFQPDGIYTDLDLHLQFVCFFRNELIYKDRSNDQKNILPTPKLTGNLSG